MRFTLYHALPVLQAILSLALVALVVSKGPSRRSLRRIFLVFLSSLGVWGLLVFAMRFSPDVDRALAWERWLMPLSVLISVSFYHFAVRYTGRPVKGQLVAGLYGIVVLAVPISVFTNLFLRGMQVKSYGYAPVFGWLMPPIAVMSASLVIGGLVALARAAKAASDADARSRALYIVLGGSASLIGMTFDILPVLGLPTYPGFIIGNILFCVLASIAILRYKLLDINIVIRRGAAYLLTTASLLFILMALWVLIVTRMNRLEDWAFIAIIAVLAVVLAPLWSVFQRRVDRLFYRERYEYLETMEMFSRETPRLTDKAMGIRIVKLLSHVLQADNISLLLPESPSGDFVVRHATTSSQHSPSVRLSARSPLIDWCARRGDVLSLHEARVMPQFIGSEKELLADLGAELSVPVRTVDGDLTGLIMVGKKSCGRLFTSEEIQWLEAFASQLSTRLENMRLYADAIKMRHELSLLSQRLVDVQEEERRNIARDLHDEIGQSLAVIKILLDSSAAQPQRTGENLAKARTMVGEVIGQVREMCLNLRPSILDDLGLLPALDWYLGRYSQRTGVRVDFKHPRDVLHVSSGVRTAAYRIVQEGLSNVARHAHAEEAQLRVWTKAGSLHIMLLDRGKGFDPAKVNSNSTGLTGIRERVSLLKGNVMVDSAPGQGTCLTVRLPLDEKEKS